MKDDFPTCLETYVTLCCYHEDQSPTAVTEALGITPTRTLIKGVRQRGRKRIAKHNAWFLSSEKRASSYDAEKHIESIIKGITGRKDTLFALAKNGWEIHLTCYWLSACGHDGPSLSPRIMGMMTDLGLPLYFDIYFNEAPILSDKQNPKLKLK